MNDKFNSMPSTLSPLADVTNKALSPGVVGAVIARPGVGKTPFLVQVALHAMSSGRRVMHVTLKDSIDKVALWYDEILSLLRERHGGVDVFPRADRLLPNRFIMTMQVAGFSVDAFRERIKDLVEQKLFVPDAIVIDGFSFDQFDVKIADALKDMGDSLSFGTWISLPVHREEARGENNIPASASAIAGPLDFIWELVPEGRKIKVVRLKDTAGSVPETGLWMDPATMVLCSD